MALKISYSRLIWEDIKRRNWLGVCIVLGLICIMPMKLAIDLEDKMQWLNVPGTMYTQKQLLQFFDGTVGFGNRYVIAAVTLCAVACGITGFLYLHSKEKQDFYHSFPLRRERWFFISYVSGALLFLVPYLICYLMMYMIGWMRDVVIEGAALQFLAVAGYHCLFFLLLYSITILSMMLTGQVIVGILGTGVFFLYGFLLIHVWNISCHEFFQTCFGTNYVNRAICASLPGRYYYGGMHIEQGIASYSDLWVIGALLAAVTTVDLLLYRIRPLEAAGHAIAFPKAEGILKIWIAVPVALGIGSLFTYSSLPGEKWITISSIAAVIFVCVVIEFIFQLDMRQVMKHKIATFISIAIVSGILFILNFDLAGYNTYLPQEDQIESMAMFTDGYRSYFTYTDIEYDEKKFLERGETGQFQEIYKLAETGVKNVNSELNGEKAELVSILYHLKNGKKVYRIYRLEAESVEAAIKNLFDSDAYKKKMLPINYLNIEQVRDIYVSDITQQQRRLSLTKEEQSTLLQILREECEKLTFEQMAYEQPIAVLETSIISEWDGENSFSSVSSGSFYIYESFEKTLAMLKACGYTPEKMILSDWVKSIYIAEYNGMNEDRQEVTNQEERSRILRNIGCASNGLVNQNFDYEKTVIIEWNNEKNDSYYYFLKRKMSALT